MAITTTRFDSGYQTVFDGLGVDASLPEVGGRQLVGHLTFAGAVGGITIKAWIGGAWSALGPEITSDLGLTRFNETTLRDYRFQIECTSYTSGNITVNYDAIR